MGFSYPLFREMAARQNVAEGIFAAYDFPVETAGLRDNVREMVLDWLAAGLDPEKSVMFKQSDVPEHAELALLLGMVTPLSWLENNPTWKEQLQELAKTKLSKASEAAASGRVAVQEKVEAAESESVGPPADRRAAVDRRMAVRDVHRFAGYARLQRARGSAAHDRGFPARACGRRVRADDERRGAVSGRAHPPSNVDVSRGARATLSGAREPVHALPPEIAEQLRRISEEDRT